MKRKIYLVPHTHWDREWYFTKNTGDVLLNQMIQEILNSNKKTPIMLDGQFSLIDDFLSSSPQHKNQISQLLQDGKMASGPFYTQPDLFNSSAETTFRNIEMGIKIGNDLNYNHLNTAYLPDTFGFNQNMPQIFKLSGLNNFIFWRGINKKLLEKSNYFYWEGIDGTKIKALNFSKGYFSLGMHYPYNGQKSGYKYNLENFLEKIDKVIKQVKINDEIILPLGGDQAPYMHEASEIINEINEISHDYQFILVSNYDAFFKHKEDPSEVFKGDLKTPLTGKIHRTISSSRYDIKRAFRNTEDNLYYLLEPLEIFYKALDKNYNFDSFKDKNIVKPLLIAQAHDSLGGCNTDEVNNNALHRLESANNNSMSQVDLVMKKIIQEKNIEDGSIVIFNPAPFENYLFDRVTFYGCKLKEINMKENGLFVHTLSSKNIALKEDKTIWKQDVLIYKNNLKPLNIESTKLKNNNIPLQSEQNIDNIIKIQNQQIDFNVNKDILSFHFKAIEDQGDSYDHSPGIKYNLKQNHKLNHIFKIDHNIYFVEVLSDLKIDNKKSLVKINFFININEKTINWKMNIHNRFINTRLSLIFKTNKHENTIIKKSQHLAISNFIENDFIDNWKESYNEYPVHVDHNDGLIKISGWNILTKGNNEIYHHDNALEITLYRAYSYVTRNNMAWRPTTSGLSFEWESPNANLQKELEFDFGISWKNDIESLNHWKYKPYPYKVQSCNFIANKMSKFVINEIMNKSNHEVKLLISPHIFISSMKVQGTNLNIRIANMLEQENQYHIKLNNKIYQGKMKSYEIKNLEIEGVYDEK